MSTTTAQVIDDECPILESVDEQTIANATANLMAGKQSRRYAKAMYRLGLVNEENILRVSIKKFNSITFGFTNPEVYRFPSSNTFVFFGEFQIEEIGGVSQKTLAAKAAKPAAAAKAIADEPAEDATGLNEKEIEMVMSQANATRNQAIKALKANKGDLVNAIMELTM